ncbi:MAG: pyridoxal phosphate-dependent aminotransferase [Polyangiaceae bacterium]|nr:pyridoxal phosphate-dependent aminotransferase [Polyangiaceae bacterium]
MQPSAFRTVPRTGVIYVMSEAGRHGYRQEDADWCNLGQGMPEAGPLEGAPPRVDRITIDVADQEYSPVAGLWELREAVAGLYNDLFRRGRGSKYSAENVAIAGGGRVSIMRTCAAIGTVNLGHFLPDYTAYEELLDVFRRFNPIPILLDPERGYAFGVDELEREILGRGLGAVLLSNPCNPTGHLIQGEELSAWVSAARRLDCTLLFDEFYSHYVWGPEPRIVSAAEYVEDVNVDPVVMFDGLTKNWRYPGWRTTWIVGPRAVIDAAASAGSFLDGGGARPLQRAAIAVVNAEHARQEGGAIFHTFGKKRERLIGALRAMGVKLDIEPQGTFYVWGDLSELPPSLRSCDDFFRAALGRKVITVPGKFFDVDPGQRRRRESRFKSHMRFSFGPSLESLELALGRLSELVASAG